MGRPKKVEKTLDERIEAGDGELDKYMISQTPPGEWRSVLTLKQPYADEIRGLADELGVAYQAMLKMLIDEALRARRERERR